MQENSLQFKKEYEIPKKNSAEKIYYKIIYIVGTRTVHFVSKFLNE
jgi:hypothetical protein